jgi:hypothetical protein
MLKIEAKLSHALSMLYTILAALANTDHFIRHYNMDRDRKEAHMRLLQYTLNFHILCMEVLDAQF